MIGSRIMVSESQLSIQREDLHFPVVTGNNLDRQEFEFPRDFEGKFNLVIYYELPTIYKMPALSRTFINEGMRAGIPDQTSRERTITLYLDKESFKRALGITSESSISLFLIDREGNILWRDEGRFSEDKAAGLAAALQELAKK